MVGAAVCCISRTVSMVLLTYSGRGSGCSGGRDRGDSKGRGRHQKSIADAGSERWNLNRSAGYDAPSGRGQGRRGWGRGRGRGSGGAMRAINSHQHSYRRPPVASTFNARSRMSSSAWASKPNKWTRSNDGENKKMPSFNEDTGTRALKQEHTLSDVSARGGEETSLPEQDSGTRPQSAPTSASCSGNTSQHGTVFDRNRERSDNSAPKNRANERAVSNFAAGEGVNPDPVPRHMKKYGSHKLVLTVVRSKNIGLGEDDGGKEVSAAGVEINSNERNRSGLSRAGHNKLVTTKGKEKPYHSRGKRPRPSCPSMHTMAPRGAKRITLTKQTTSFGNDGSAENRSSNQEKSDHPVEAAKLSDFAYRETKKVVPRNENRNKTWTNTGTTANLGTVSATWAPRSMGLVRVPVDESTTPVCPAFLKGADCKNRFCTKRHDISKECAMPVCSFFQRMGQCLKGDKCQFRHVKVNAWATAVCPTFTKLGFCEDEECSFLHVRGERRAPGARKSHNKG